VRHVAFVMINIYGIYQAVTMALRHVLPHVPLQRSARL
jgi:hypothetical protein